MALTREHDEAEIAEVLKRAHELQFEGEELLNVDPSSEELVRAAEEAGLSRGAVMQALRERLGPIASYRENQRVFAIGADGRFYVAKVLEPMRDQVRVRFMNGTEGQVATRDVKPFSLQPGIKLEYHSPSMYSHVEGELLNYNDDAGSLRVSYWGVEETITLDRIRLPRRKDDPRRLRDEKIKMWVYGTLLALGSGGLGALATYLAMR